VITLFAMRSKAFKILSSRYRESVEKSENTEHKTA